MFKLVKKDEKSIPIQHISILAGLLALYGLMLIVGLVQAVVSIVASGFSCAAVCCQKKSNYPGNVIFAPPSNTKNPTCGPVPVLLNA